MARRSSSFYDIGSTRSGTLFAVTAGGIVVAVLACIFIVGRLIWTAFEGFDPVAHPNLRYFDPEARPSIFQLFCTILISLAIAGVARLACIPLGMWKWFRIPHKVRRELQQHFLGTISFEEAESAARLLAADSWSSVSEQHRERLWRLPLESCRHVLETEPKLRSRLLASAPDVVLATWGYLKPTEKFAVELLVNPDELAERVRREFTARPGCRSLSAAIDANVARVISATGRGLEALAIEVECSERRLEIPFGTVLVPSSDCQQMVVRNSVVLDFSNSRTQSVLLSVACIQHQKEIPTHEDSFTSFVQAGPLIEYVLAVSKCCGLSAKVTQYAVWQVTDNVRVRPTAWSEAGVYLVDMVVGAARQLVAKGERAPAS